MAQAETPEDPLVKVVLAIREGLTMIVEQLNEVLAAYAPETVIPRLDIAAIEGLEWISYQTKKAAQRSESAWIFRTTPGAEELVKAIEASENHRVELGEYDYGFSGPEKQFIARRPRKV